MLTKICNTFSVNSDYLLGITFNENLDISNLSIKEKKIIFALLSYFNDTPTDKNT